MVITTDLQRIIDEQQGVVHRHQLYEHGVTRAALRAALGRRWQVPLPGVVATFTGTMTDQQRLRAATLYAGRPAQLTGVEACRLHGLTSLPPPGVTRFVVPTHRRARAAGWVRVSPTTRADGASRALAGITVVSLARAVVDAAPDLRGREETTALVLESVQRRLTRIRALRHELERAPVPGSRWMRAAVVAAESGAWSAPEADLLALLATSSVLPPVVPNPVLRARSGERLPCPDAWIPDAGVAVQVHSRRYHSRDTDFDDTLDVDATLTAHGAAVIAVTPRRIRDEGPVVLARIERAFLERQRRGVSVDIVMEPRPTH